MKKELKKIRQRVERLEKRVNRLEGGRKIDSKSTSTKRLSLGEFLSSADPGSKVDTAIVIGYYLENYRDFDIFNVPDLESNFRRAKESSPANINDTVNQAVKRDMMMETNKKKNSKKAWVLTNTGEEYVENKLLKSN